MTSLQEVKTIVPIHLHPRNLTNIASGVEECLNSYLLRYVPELGGCILSYSDVRYRDAAGLIFFERPHINFNVECKFLVYCIAVNNNLIGIVNRVAVDHLGLLVAGFINVSLHQENIPNYYRYDNNTTNQWLDTRLYPELDNSQDIPVNTINNNNNNNDNNPNISKKKLDKKAQKLAEKEARRQAYLASQNQSQNDNDNTTTNNTNNNNNNNNDSSIPDNRIEHNIQVGSRIKFCVLQVHTIPNSDFFSINGSLIKPNTRLLPGPPLIIGEQYANLRALTQTVKKNRNSNNYNNYNNYNNNNDEQIDEGYDYTQNDSNNIGIDDTNSAVTNTNKSPGGKISKKDAKLLKKQAKEQKKLEKIEKKKQRKLERTNAYHAQNNTNNNNNINNNSNTLQGNDTNSIKQTPITQKRKHEDSNNSSSKSNSKNSENNLSHNAMPIHSHKKQKS